MTRYIFASLIISFAVTSTFAQTRAKMLHVVIKADTFDVYVGTNWLFRSDSDKPDHVTIQVPKDACDIRSEDSALAIDRMSGTISLDVNDSAAMTCSYSIRNNNGTAGLPLILPVGVDSIAVFVSGSATRIENPFLKYDVNLAQDSHFAAVYSARNVPAGPLNIIITGLPAKPSRLYKAVAVFLSILILSAAALTVVWGKKNHAAC